MVLAALAIGKYLTANGSPNSDCRRNLQTWKMKIMF